MHFGVRYGKIILLQLMNKVVIKAATITVGALAAAGILIFSLWILISPQSMAAVSERLGNYGFAVTCADLKYKYSGDSYDLARCCEDSILSGDDGLVLKYCGQLVEKEDFDGVCRRRDEELARTEFGSYTLKYNTYIISNLAVSQYRAGDLEKAVATAESGEEVECFRKLVIEIRLSGSASDAEALLTLPTRLDAIEYIKGLLSLPLK